MADTPAQDRKQDRESEVETTTFQRDNWQAAHSSTLTANAQTVLQTMGRHVEAAVTPSSGGGRGNDSGGVPAVVQAVDGQTLAMQNYKNIFSPAMLDNRVLLAQDQTENRARADAQLIQEIKDRSPFIAYAAQGTLQQVTAMVSKLGEGPLGNVIPGGPTVTGAPGAAPAPPQPVSKNEFAVS